MLTESFQSIATATRQLLRNWSVMIVLAGLYASLIAALYLFATIREASAGQVVSKSGPGNHGAIPLLRTANRRRQPNP